MAKINKLRRCNGGKEVYPNGIISTDYTDYLHNINYFVLWREKEVRHMKVKVIKRYNDMVLRKIQKPDTVLEVSDERGKYLIGQGVAVECEPEKKSTGKG